LSSTQSENDKILNISLLLMLRVKDSCAMKKQKVITISIILALIACALVYFRPMSLANSFDKEDRVFITLTNLHVKDGTAINDSKNYDAIREDSKTTLLELLNRYPYRRTLSTLFSDGSIEDGGDKVLYIFVYEANTLKASILVTPSGKISVNNKNYKMKHAEEFIERTLSNVK
jgi:hypothetical protein